MSDIRPIRLRSVAASAQLWGMRGYRLLERTGSWTVSVAVVIAGFAAFQVFGTAVVADRAQQELSNQFQGEVADDLEAGFTMPEYTLSEPEPSEGSPAPTPTDGGASPAQEIATAEVSSANLFAELGAPVAQIEIPAIGVSQVVVLGDRRQDLAVGPGVSPLLAAPGSSDSNVVIAGHRTTHGGPFRQIDDLKPGDIITLRTMYGVFDYAVTGTRIVKPDDTTVLVQTPTPTLTLYTCNPEYSTRERLVVAAEPVGPAADFPIRFAVAEQIPEPLLQVTTTEVASDQAAAAAPELATGETEVADTSPSVPAAPQVTSQAAPLSAMLADVYAAPESGPAPLEESTTWSNDRSAWVAVAVSAFMLLAAWRFAVELWAVGGAVRRVLSVLTAAVVVTPVLVWFYWNFAAVTPVGF